MKPRKSYRIWFSQRNGSTLLCKGLEQTGIAGKPIELFNLSEKETLREKYQVNTYKELKEQLWAIGMSGNGIFGMKHSMHRGRMKKITQEILELKGVDSKRPINEEEIYSEIFPNCHHIYLTRRNKIRQAVSWWKAIKDNQWHITKNEKVNEEAEFYEKHYDFNAINHLFKEASLRECAIQDYFDQHEIYPQTIVYEDFVKRYEETIKMVIDFIGIKYDKLSIKEKYYQKMSNERSEEWVQRFRKDLQKKMGIDIW